MPFAARHAPFAAPADGGPGDFVAEYVAQTRGWFYTMTVLSTALFAAPPFTRALCHGVLLGEDGRKMSKRLRNYTDPMALVAAHGADALRVALLTSGVVDGADARFAAAAVPYLWLSTSMHDDYHLPSDSPDKVDPATIATVGRMVVAVIAGMPDRAALRPAAAAR